MILTPDELLQLTKRPRPSAQRRELEHLGIPYRARRDGSLIVLREHVTGTQDVQPRRPQLRIA